MHLTKADYIEFQKCKNDIYYFYNKYVTIKMKSIKKITVLQGKDFEEIQNIYYKYFTEKPGQPEGYVNSIMVIEKIVDDDIEYMISFNHSNEAGKMLIKHSDVVRLLRKEKINKICQHK